MALFSVLSFIAQMPVDRSRMVFSSLEELQRYKSEPQRRVDATFRYIEAIENGEELGEGGFLSVPPAKYYDEYVPKYKLSSLKTDEKTCNKPYQRPLYIRDKHNPKILYPYTGK